MAISLTLQTDGAIFDGWLFVHLLKSPDMFMSKITMSNDLHWCVSHTSKPFTHILYFLVQSDVKVIDLGRESSLSDTDKWLHLTSHLLFMTTDST